jgi:hypothetical protein
MGHDDRTFMRHPDLTERQAALRVLAWAAQQRDCLSPSEHDLLRRLVLAGMVGEALPGGVLEQARSVIARCNNPDPTDPFHLAPPLDLTGDLVRSARSTWSKRAKRWLQSTGGREFILIAVIGVLAALWGWVFIAPGLTTRP